MLGAVAASDLQGTTQRVHPARVSARRCHAGFVGVRCEHADLLAVVATEHRQQTVATALVMCVVGCVLVMLLCALLQ